jgi:hypothetical protein
MGLFALSRCSLSFDVHPAIDTLNPSLSNALVMGKDQTEKHTLSARRRNSAPFQPAGGTSSSSSSSHYQTRRASNAHTPSQASRNKSANATTGPPSFGPPSSSMKGNGSRHSVPLESKGRKTVFPSASPPPTPAPPPPLPFPAPVIAPELLPFPSDPKPADIVVISSDGYTFKTRKIIIQAASEPLDDIVEALVEQDVKPADVEKLDGLQALRLEATRAELMELMSLLDPLRYPSVNAGDSLAQLESYCASVLLPLLTSLERIHQQLTNASPTFCRNSLYSICDRYAITTHLRTASDRVQGRLNAHPAKVLAFALIIRNEGLARQALPYFDRPSISLADMGIEKIA